VFGEPADDNAYNRRFADRHNILVVELNYSKAPWSPFPIGLYDLEAIILAVYDDSSLPIDQTRIAVGGFSAGGNLALAVVQLPSIRERVSPSAVLSIFPTTDQSISTEVRCSRRYFKPNLPPKRNESVDYLSKGPSMFKWSCIPYGQNLHDPLLSPFYAPRENLPRNIYIVAAELDQYAPEA
jgi:acetyl esterase/lipase